MFMACAPWNVHVLTDPTGYLISVAPPDGYWAIAARIRRQDSCTQPHLWAAFPFLGVARGLVSAR